MGVSESCATQSIMMYWVPGHNVSNTHIQRSQAVSYNLLMQRVAVVDWLGY